MGGNASSVRSFGEECPLLDVCAKRKTRECTRHISSCLMIERFKATERKDNPAPEDYENNEQTPPMEDDGERRKCRMCGMYFPAKAQFFIGHGFGDVCVWCHWEKEGRGRYERIALRRRDE